MLSIAIATMRRWDFLKDSIPVYLARPEVKEVILCDETGEDCAAALASPFGTHPKLRLVTNEKRLGIYQNKRKALSLAKGEWVAVLDSDNFFSDEWFDTLLRCDFSNKKQIYGSADCKFINNITNEITYPLKAFSGLTLSRENWNTMFQKERWTWILNDGNWVVPKDTIYCLPDFPEKNLHAADAIYMLRLFIKYGYKITFVPDLEYLHIVHSGSSWLETDTQSTHVINTFNWKI